MFTYSFGSYFMYLGLWHPFFANPLIYLPLVLAGEKHKEMEKKIDPIAKKLGIHELLEKYPYEISGGQKQRVAVARAIITKPDILLADEPTGALDSGSTDELLRLFRQINEEGQSILMVTHSVKAASTAGRVLFIKDGVVYHQLYRANMGPEEFYKKISDSLTALVGSGDQ